MRFLVFVLSLIAATAPVYAQSTVRVPGKIIISQELADAIFRQLAADPNVGLAFRLNNEMAPQLPQVNQTTDQERPTANPGIGAPQKDKKAK